MKIPQLYQIFRKIFLWGLPLILVFFVAANLMYEQRRIEGWKVYSPEKNLWSKSIKIDSIGNIWIGTNMGVFLFNNKESITYTEENSGLPDSNVYNIEIDPLGNVWITMYHGVGVFDGKDWTTYTKENSGLPSNRIQEIVFDPSGNAWISTYDGIGVFDRKEWIMFNTGRYITGIAFDSFGRAWIATHDGVAVFDGKDWTTYLWSLLAMACDSNATMTNLSERFKIMKDSPLYKIFKKFLLFALPFLLVVLVVSMLIYEKRIDKGWAHYQVDHSGVDLTPEN